MKNINRLISLAFFSALVFFVLPVCPAAALGPQAGNCSWGNYGKSDVIYLSANSGTSNEDQINAALNQIKSQGKKSVYLKAGTYLIDGQITMPSGSVLEGDKDAVIKLKDSANWRAASFKDPLIGGNSLSNVEIKCFTIDGNYSFSGGNQVSSRGCWGGIAWNSSVAAFTACENQSGGKRYHGKGYYTLLAFNSIKNLSVHDMVLQDGANDGLRVQSSSGIKFYNNTVNAMGHEVLYANVSHGIEMHHNDMKLRASGGARGDDCYDYVIYDNVFESYNHKDSSSGVQIDAKRSKSVYNVQIYRNVFINIWNVGVWLSVGSVPKYNGDYAVKIHHNIFKDNGYSNNSQVGATGGIVSNGSISTIIYNNVFDGNYGSGIYNTGSVSKIINNIVVGTRKGKYGGAGSGAGIDNSGSSVSYNCLNDNVGGNLLRSSGSSNVFSSPLFADASSNDYHLKSRAGRWNSKQSQWVTDSVSSPCIDSGTPFSSGDEYTAYSKEPANNGGRINAGAYGNTSQASLTGNSPQSPMPPAPTEEDYPSGFSSTDDGGGEEEPSYPIYPYSPDSILPDIEPPIYILPSLPDEEVPVTPLYPTPDNAPDTATSACMVKADTAGLIPCGKSFNDPATSWNECQECGFCSFVLMIQLILERLIELAGILALLMLIASGAYHVVAAGNAGMLAKAKAASERAVYGFIMVLLAWLIVDFILSALGFIDPAGGKWHIICDQSASSGYSSSSDSSDVFADNSAQYAELSESVAKRHEDYSFASKREDQGVGVNKLI